MRYLMVLIFVLSLSSCSEDIAEKSSSGKSIQKEIEVSDIREDAQNRLSEVEKLIQKREKAQE